MGLHNQIIAYEGGRQNAVDSRWLSVSPFGYCLDLLSTRRYAQAVPGKMTFILPDLRALTLLLTALKSGLALCFRPRSKSQRGGGPGRTGRVPQKGVFDEGDCANVGLEKRGRHTARCESNYGRKVRVSSWPLTCIVKTRLWQAAHDHIRLHLGWMVQNWLCFFFLFFSQGV